MAHRARGEEADGQKRRGAVTVKDVIADALTPIAQSYWAPGATDLLPFDPKVIEDIYQNELSKFDQSRVAILEFSQYLENYLWRYFDPQTSTFAHIMSTVLLVNEKFRDTSLNPWDAFHSRPEHFESFLHKVFSLGRDNPLNIKEKTAWVLFFINCFQTMEDSLVRSVCQRLISVSMWHYISDAGLARIFKQHPRLQTAWNKSRQTAKGADKSSVEAAFFPSLVLDLLHILEHPGSSGLARLSPQAIEGLSSGAEQGDEDYSESVITYCERMLEFIIDLLAQLLTRRFLRPLLEDLHFLVRAQLSKLHKSREGVLFGQMLERVRFYMGFEIDDWRGVPLSESDMISQHYARLAKLQRIAFKHFPSLRPLAMASVSQIDTPVALGEFLSALSVEELKALADRLHLLSPATEHYHANRVFLTNVLVLAHERRTSQKQLINSLPLYPDENVLWDENLVPSVHYSGDTCLALPKLNLQFLTFHDYLLRNFHLFRLESTYEIREDISKTVRRLAPRLSPNNVETIFTGWARYASPLKEFKVTQVKKPNVGETKPSVVRAEITINISNFTGAIRQEWEELKKHDVMFLLTIRAHPGMGYTSEVLVEEDAEDVEVSAAGDRHKLGVKYVRGCEIVEVMDESRSVVGERNKDGKIYYPTGNIRIYRVVLDSAQYEKDMNGAANGLEDPYKTFNLLMRRRPKENNFKAVLKTIRDLMKVDKESALAPVPGSAKQEVRVIRSSVVPSWLHDVFLGYGAPDSAQYYKLPTQIPSFEFADTFLDAEHARSCFPGSNIKMLPLPESEDPKGTGLSFRVTSPLGSVPNYDALMKAVLETTSKSEVAAEAKAHPLTTDGDSAKRAKTTKSNGASNGSAEPSSPTRRKAPAGSQAASMDVDGESKDDADAVVIEPLERGLPSLLSSRVPRRNNVRFTPMQVEAIKSGLQPGLTMIVGPPGTGKTDVAVQIMSELFHNFPGQRTLLVTHSNHALNDLFEKIMERDIDERYLLRLGHGEAALSSEKDFSKFGRVNYMLERRMALLQHVARLARAIGVAEDVAYTCENASHFFLYHVQSRWEAFLDAANKRLGSPEAAQFIADQFPFSKYFLPEATPIESDDSAPAPAPSLFTVTPATTPAATMTTARQHYRDIERLFAEVDECRPFEVLRNYMDRGAYLLTKHAKVIAMTCTHAAIKRGDFVDLSFQYDNLVMEEAAQILEIETFIPMLLQKDDAEAGCRLKRIVLLGDHHQLPPIIKNMAFQKYSRMDQSLFTRFVRLGVPTLQLNAQGRMRPELATLWNWRYKHLGNLPNVLPQPAAAESTDVATAVTSSSYGHIDPRFSLANPGLGHVFQFINVPDFNGQGEISPNPFFYQNLGEAEYAVQLFMLMRLLGYPAHSISIITPYKGQKHLIRDIVNQRCARNPLFGTPLKVATVDKYQGQQNDYVILSLVRTRTAGHIRDVRRLIVAMSRARLGVYVLGRQSLYQNVLELAHTFNVLLTKPTKLVVIPSEFETRVTTRRPGDGLPADALEIDDVKHIGQLVYSLTDKIRSQLDVYQKQVEEFEQKEKDAAERAVREAERKKVIAERLKAEQSDLAKMAAEGKLEANAEKLMRRAAGEEVADEPKETVVIEGSVFEIPDVDGPVPGAASDDDDDF